MVAGAISPYLLSAGLLARMVIARQAGSGSLQEVRGSFEFNARTGARSIGVGYYRPVRAAAESRVLFLIHGSSRTEAQAREIGASLAPAGDRALPSAHCSLKVFVRRRPPEADPRQ